MAACSSIRATFIIENSSYISIGYNNYRTFPKNEYDQQTCSCRCHLAREKQEKNYNHYFYTGQKNNVAFSI